MKLQARLALSLGVAGLLLLAGVAALHRALGRRLVEEAIRNQVAARTESQSGTEACSAAAETPFRPGGFRPERRPRGGRGGPGLSFYSRGFVPLNEFQPPLPPNIQRALAAGASLALNDGEPRRSRDSGPPGPPRGFDGPSGPRGPGGVGGPGRPDRGELGEMSIGAIPTGWDDERCAYAATFVPRPSGLRLEPALVALALGSLGILAGTLYVAAGSPARRIRSLASAVRAAAEGRYQATVRVDGRDEIADLSNAFNEASAVVRSHVDQVERRERTLRDFVAHTHHDVGLPLTVLSGHLASLRDGAEAGETPPPAIIAAAIQEAQYIASLLHNLGAVAQLEAEPGLPRASEVDLRRLVERVALRHQDVARSASIELNHAVPEEPVIVFGDLTLLEQAVNNLVHNAIRYNRAGGHVAVSLDASDGKFALTVEDDGPGVAPETLTRLGEPRFRSEEARSRRPEGSGLGLSIARDVTARHGFELSLASPQGGGFVARVLGKSGGELRRA